MHKDLNIGIVIEVIIFVFCNKEWFPMCVSKNHLFLFFLFFFFKEKDDITINIEPLQKLNFFSENYENISCTN